MWVVILQYYFNPLQEFLVSLLRPTSLYLLLGLLRIQDCLDCPFGGHKYPLLLVILDGIVKERVESERFFRFFQFCCRGRRIGNNNDVHFSADRVVLSIVLLITLTANLRASYYVDYRNDWNKKKTLLFLPKNYRNKAVMLYYIILCYIKLCYV